MNRRITVATGLMGGIVALDVLSKSWATESLHHGLTVQGLAGVPLTLAYNQGVAFGLPLPSAGRWIIIAATIVVLVVLSRMFMKTEGRDWLRLLALQLVGAGAIGNLIDRVRWPGGVVDFIGPFGNGPMQFPIFNVADMAITTGALMLALSLLREEDAATVALSEPTQALDIDGTVG